MFEDTGCTHHGERAHHAQVFTTHDKGLNPMKYRTTGIDGVLNIYKEKGFTSHDVVAVARKLTGCKTGHTGTLDPDAEGVLPVCLGKATRISDHIASETKEYTAIIAFGTETDTQDASGAVTAVRALSLNEDALRTVILSFIGDIDQLPPMYSALKVNGQKLYDLARAGKTIERQPRRIHIHDIQILEIDWPHTAQIHVVCSKGTYIRTLCEDIGRKAEAAAHMQYLLRTRAGAFSLDNSITLTALKELIEATRLMEAVLPMRNALSAYREAQVDGEAAGRALYNGAPVELTFVRLPADTSDGERFLLLDEHDALLGIYSLDTEGGKLRPVVVLV